MKKFFMVALAAISMCVTQSSAALISGSFGFDTGNVLVAGLTNSSLTFTSNPVFALLNSPSGDFSTFANDNDPITIAPSLTLNTGNLAVSTFVFSGFTFTPSSFSGPTLVQQMGSFYFVALNGVYSGHGFTPTGGVFNISFQSPSNNGAFTASGSGSVIPEPSTYAMLGSALIGLGLLRRRKA